MIDAREQFLSRTLVRFFASHGRDLPWRSTKDPYAILVSELMLQQTQVSRVIPKWRAWLERFPDFKTLANAPTRDVLQLWSGLGYNSRALRLRELAIVVMKEWRGKLPHEPEQLLTLPGIGPYTANAVASFAFGADVLAMDTNLKRVLGRYFGTAEIKMKVPRGKAYAMNAALMDIGASVCGRTPDCANCPLQKYCVTQGRAKHEVKKPKAQKFAESDRCIRGSIMRALIEKSSTPAILKRIASQRCINVTPERLSKILHALQREGLVKCVGSKISLP